MRKLILGLSFVTLLILFWVQTPLGVYGDPDNFGYETKGSSEYNTYYYILGSIFTCPETGTANSITAYLAQHNTYTPDVAFAIYKASDDSLVGYTEEWTLTAGWDDWKTLDIVSGGTLEATDYHLVIWSSTYIIKYYDTEATSYYKSEVYDYPNFPNPFVRQYGPYDKKWSIYCSYTPSGAPPPVYPTQPQLYLPSDGSDVYDTTPYFEWTNGENADNHRLLVDVSPPDWAGNSIDVVITENNYTPASPLSDDNYSWKVIAQNENGDNTSAIWTFNVISIKPTQPILYLPLNGATLEDDTPYFEWTLGENADNHRFLVWITDNEDYKENRVLTDNHYTIASEDALPNDNYSWKVIAQNENGENSSIAWTFLINAPKAPVLIAPKNGATITDNTPTFEWENTTENSWLLLDDDADFSSPLENRLIVADNSYTIPNENALAIGTYYWKIIDTDNNEASAWHFTVTLAEAEAEVTDEIIDMVMLAITFGVFGVIAFAVHFKKGDAL